jgi:hypothetical protein
VTLAFPKPAPRGRKPKKPITRGGRPRHRRKTSRADLVAEADRLFSRFILTRYGAMVYCEACGAGAMVYCEACGAEVATDCGHGVPRASYATRWDPGNAWALCRRCHNSFGNSPAWRAWRVRRLGEEKVQAQERMRGQKVPTEHIRGVVADLDWWCSQNGMVRTRNGKAA